MTNFLEIPFVRISANHNNLFIKNIFPEKVAYQYSAAPLGLEDNQLIIAFPNPMDEITLKAIGVEARRAISPRLSTYTDIRASLDQTYHNRSIQYPPINAKNAAELFGYQLDSSGDFVVDLPGKQNNLSETDRYMRIIQIKESAKIESLGLEFFLPHINLKDFKLQTGLVLLVPWSLVQERAVLPLWWANKILILVTNDPLKAGSEKDLSEKIGLPTRLVISSKTDFDALAAEYYSKGEEEQSCDDEAIIRNLISRNILSVLDLQSAQTLAKQTNDVLGNVLLEKNFITRSDWLYSATQLSKIPSYEKNHFQTMPSFKTGKPIFQIVPYEIARRFGLVPLDGVGVKMKVGFRNPQKELIDLVETITGMAVDAFCLDPLSFIEQMHLVYDQKPPNNTFLREPDFNEWLMITGVITPDQLKDAELSTGERWFELGQTLIQMGALDEFVLSEILSVQTGIPYASFELVQFNEELVNCISANLAEHHHMLPLLQRGKDLWVAVANPLDGEGLKSIEKHSGLRVWPIIAPLSIIQSAIDRFFSKRMLALELAVHLLADELISTKVLTQAQSIEVMQLITEKNLPFDHALRDVKGLSEEEVVKIFSEIDHIPTIDITLQEDTVSSVDALGQLITHSVIKDPVDAQIAQLFDMKIAEQWSALPVKRISRGILVAFTNPLFQGHMAEIEQHLGAKILPHLVTRTSLREAIQRVLGRKNIGTLLFTSGIITRAQLNDALELAKNSGVRLGRALLDRRYVTQDQLYRFLADQAKLPFIDLSTREIDPEVARMIDQGSARKYGILPIGKEDQRVILTMTDPLDTEALKFAEQKIGKVYQAMVVSEGDMEEGLEKVYKNEYLASSVSGLLERSPEDSAYRVLTRTQLAFLLLFAIISIIGIWIIPIPYFILLNIFSSAFYLLFSSYKFYLIYHALRASLEISVSEEEVQKLNNRDLPIYTILVPVYHEAKVLGDLLQAITRFDYPSTKLDIKVMMEEDDQETIQAFHKINPPPMFEGLIVPSAQPKTKPKACNYGLIHARGEYVVIYDAEDLPDADQLKKVILAFKKAPPEVACIQSKLNYYNRNQNLLTRLFTIEYSMWFDLFLPGLDASRAPIPLGGTSNHFKRDALIECGAWDPHNVTEDADLGIRLFKRGYRTGIVDSTTYEEANSELRNWLRQRSRWIKGYIQTWLVVMRHPIRLIKDIGLKPFLSIQLVIGGTFFSALLNPVYWGLTTLWFLSHWGLIQQLFPPIIYYIGGICLYLGNFAFVYMNLAGAMRRGYYDMVKYALFSPLYWGLMSVAAWKGFFQLITRPHFWEKTEHGLMKNPTDHSTFKQTE